MSRRRLRAPESIRSRVRVIRYSVLLSIAQKREKVKGRMTFLAEALSKRE
jgi:hypothetical protein